eukprot:TRINITY_DN1368_c0_g3_i2.p1 TRINITY_DN1368_c0_g3~~TRINITY_DN1368_c0_g3_i2.p1  ORF type:complete len:191 (+),score=46.49 TRINITY_DN1368_c0_g3_i2:137-709(+)
MNVAQVFLIVAIVGVVGVNGRQLTALFNSTSARVAPFFDESVFNTFVADTLPAAYASDEQAFFGTGIIEFEAPNTTFGAFAAFVEANTTGVDPIIFGNGDVNVSAYEFSLLDLDIFGSSNGPGGFNIQAIGTGEVESQDGDSFGGFDFSAATNAQSDVNATTGLTVDGAINNTPTSASSDLVVCAGALCL